MIKRTALMVALSATASIAGIRSGNAEADWLTASTTCQAGQPVQTAVRLVVDAGWHTYWQNPGVGGMKISVEWELPAGWKAGELQYPVPERLMTGEVAGFGYHGTVLFPVSFTPPAGFNGEAKLKGKVSWLTCDDENCTPGDAELELSLTAGNPSASEQVKEIQAAMAKVPQAQEGWVHLHVTEKPDAVSLVVEAHLSRPLNLNDYEIFPATPQTIDPAAKIQFTRSGAEWRAEVPKSEYATVPLKELTLVLAGKNQQPPMSLTWRAAPAKEDSKGN